MTEQEKLTQLTKFINEGVRDTRPTDNDNVKSYIEANKQIKDLFEKHDRQSFIKEIDKNIEHYSTIDSDRGKGKHEAFTDIAKEYHKLF